MTWPPEGPMNMVFTQLLYINFCEPNISIQDHWQAPQFDELLAKINEHIPSAIQQPSNHNSNLPEDTVPVGRQSNGRGASPEESPQEKSDTTHLIEQKLEATQITEKKSEIDENAQADVILQPNEDNVSENHAIAPQEDTTKNISSTSPHRSADEAPITDDHPGHEASTFEETNTQHQYNEAYSERQYRDNTYNNGAQDASVNHMNSDYYHIPGAPPRAKAKRSSFCVIL